MTVQANVAVIVGSLRKNSFNRHAAQALCKLPGTGARDLSDLLRGLSGIDQTRLFKWSGEALSLALKPARARIEALTTP